MECMVHGEAQELPVQPQPGEDAVRAYCVHGPGHRSSLQVELEILLPGRLLPSCVLFCVLVTIMIPLCSTSYHGDGSEQRA